MKSELQRPRRRISKLSYDRDKLLFHGWDNFFSETNLYTRHHGRWHMYHLPQ